MNVRQLMDQILKDAGVTRPYDFQTRSPQHMVLWDRVSAIWTTRGIDPELVPNVDEAVVLEEGEFEQFLAQARALG